MIGALAFPLMALGQGMKGLSKMMKQNIKFGFGTFGGGQSFGSNGTRLNTLA